jgi:hypothetical protein
MKKIALVTGATSGIGEAAAFALGRAGFNLIITGRRSSLLMKVTDQLKEEVKAEVLPLCFDVRELSDVEKYIGGLPENWKKIDLLINNAGLAVGLSPLNEGVIDDWERMIDTNIKGLLYMTRVVSGLMITNGGGHIINIGSIAGKTVYPNGNVYCATKYAVDALSKGMSMDLVKHKIKVSQICPGAVETEFSLVRFKGDKEKADDVYKGFKPLSASDVADAIAYIACAPAHVNISDLVIMPSAQASAVQIQRNL